MDGFSTQRLTRPDVARYIRDKTGAPVSPRSVERLPIPYVCFYGRALYAPEDVDAWIAERMRQAARRVAPSARRRDLDHLLGNATA